ncbi:MAG: hypothetical protein II411_01490 [Lachnospiraceae bacterium]|nr:hypothetical protein [Lachnospiraceae bacterium]
MTHVVFFGAYVYFLCTDIKRKQIDLVALAIYAVAALITVGMSRDNITMARFMDLLFSIAFGLIIFLISYFSGEGIGLADGLYFAINGLLLSLRENIILFLSGLLVAFILGIVMFFFGNNRSKNARLPFMPCLLPAIIGYILCIV